MKNDPIGIFDSGLGGLTILKVLKEYLPHEDFIYYGDSLYNPYGEKTKEEVLKRAMTIVAHLVSKHCKLIVIACNTATMMCIDVLRKRYSIPIVGTEPALKVAMDENPNQTVLVMATPGTIESEKFKALFHHYLEQEDHIHLLKCPNLAHLIELGVKEEIRMYLQTIFEPYRHFQIGSIILGCTHYSLIRNEIAAFFPKAHLLDGRIEIARKVQSLLREQDLFKDTGQGKLEIENSLNDEMVKKSYRLLEQEF